jgi:hypothetical protein
MKHLLFTVAACLTLASPVASDPTAHRAALQALHGTFHSPAVEAWYGGNGTLEFVFSDGQRSPTFTHAVHPAHTATTLRLKGGASDFRDGP